MPYSYSVIHSRIIDYKTLVTESVCESHLENKYFPETK